MTAISVPTKLRVMELPILCSASTRIKRSALALCDANTIFTDLVLEIARLELCSRFKDHQSGNLDYADQAALRSTMSVKRAGNRCASITIEESAPSIRCWPMRFPAVLRP
jgi:hypothetical protein